MAAECESAGSDKQALGLTGLKARFNVSLQCLLLQGCSSPIVVKFADTQKDKEQKRMAQQLQQQMQQINAASVWGNLAGLNSLAPQYLAVSVRRFGPLHFGVVRPEWQGRTLSW